MGYKTNKTIRKLMHSFIFILDILLAPFVFFSSIIMYFVRKIGFKNNRLRICRNILLKIGVMPIIDHYYEPLINFRKLNKPLSEDRRLQGINWNIKEQLKILKLFKYNHELNKIPNKYVSDMVFNFDNESFLSGDAEYWYNLIRLKKPKTIIEIGSGNSTKMARLAIKRNNIEDKNYQCNHICVEPYEQPWLEKLGIEIIRKRVELIDVEFFSQLGENDILFIDSSHIIRPQGDVLYEFLELLPTLKKGVIVHVHDIFSPKDYPESWVINAVKFWNEQYLLEAFLTSNNDWEIIGSLNYLHHNYYDRLKEKCPRLTLDREPGSFYIIKKN